MEDDQPLRLLQEEWDLTLLEVFNFYIGEHSSSLARGTNLDTKAAAMLAVLGLFGTIFLSSSTGVSQYIGRLAVQIEGLVLLILFAFVVFSSVSGAAIRPYYVIFDGYLLNVKLGKGRIVRPNFDLKALLQDNSQLMGFLDPSFDRVAYLRQNILNLVHVTTKNRNVNWAKARWLIRAQVIFVFFLVVLILLAITVGYLEYRSGTEHRVPAGVSDVYQLE